MATKDIDPLGVVGANDVAANKKSVETSAQQWVESCGVCHVGGGSLEYDRDLNWYSADSGSGDAFLIKYASKVDPSYVTVSAGYMSSTNKAEMDCLMCHLDGSNPGAAWLRTLGCGPNNPVGPAYDPACIGTADGHGPMGRYINASMEDKVGEYDMFNRNFALKQYQPGLAASMGAGATGIFTGTDLTGVDWGPTAVAPIKMTAGRIVKTPKSENCSVCHARYDDTMGLPGMMAMKTGFGNFDLLYRPDAVGDVDVPIPAGIGGVFQDLDTDNGPAGVNDDFFQDFGCKTGMGKRAHKVNPAGELIGANARYGMTPMLPSTMDADAGTTPNVGDIIAGKMPDIDVHNTAGMQCATCHYALGSDNENGYIDIPARTSHGSDYPGERIYAVDHQFAQADSFPDVKGKENLDNMMRCESCHITQDHPNTGTAVIPAHANFPQVHLDKIGCATCHIPETYSAPGRLKYRDFSAGFWHHSQKNVLDWNYDLMTGSHNTVPSLHRWLNKSANIADEGAKIYPVLPSVMPTWFQVVPDSGLDRDNTAKVCMNGTAVIPADVSALNVTDACDNGTPATRTGTVGQVAATAYAPAYKACFDGAVIAANMIQYADVSPAATIGEACDNSTAATLAGTVALASGHDGRGDVTYTATTFSSPVKSRDAALAAEYVRDNGGVETGGFVAGKGDGVCGPGGTCVGGINAGNGCSDRTDCTKFDIRVNGANTFPLFDGFQLADGLEIDTKVEVDAMLAAFAAGANGADAPFTQFMALVQVDFDVTHGIVPKEWALGGSMRGGCVSCHSSKDPASPNYNKHSVGFFEGYVQPMDKAGMMIGGYDLIKNWTAMFADFDCTAFCGMGTQGDSAFFHPMTGQIQTGAACSAGSMFGTIDQCVGLMTSKFDAAMGFPDGTAMQMGMYDGIAGLQGFTINTLQTIGYQGCNPFGGPTSGNSPAGSVNKCMPAPGLQPTFDAALTAYTGAPAAGLATCDTVTTHVCENGFRTGGGCANDADCQGSMTNTQEIAHNPMGLILSRKEVRSRQKIDLQQGYPGNDATLASNIRWSMSITKNPGNGAHVNKWDQAEYCIDRNPVLYPNPFAPGAISCRAIPYTQTECTDGLGIDGTWTGSFCSSAQSPDGQRHIMHLMTANQYLGYAPGKLAELMIPVAPATAIHSHHVQFACVTCHANGAPDIVSGINPDADPAAPYFTFTPSAGAGLPTCTAICHVVASAPDQNTVVTARVSDKHSVPGPNNDPGQNFTVTLDGSASACYAVNRITGQVAVTPGTKTYAWTYQDTAPASTSACPAPRAGDPSCVVATWAVGGTNDVTLEVTCIDGGSNPTATKTVAVTGIDIGAGDNDDPNLAVSRSLQTVTLTAPDLDSEVAKADISWGDGSLMSSITGTFNLADFADSGIGIIHTYQGGKTYSISVTTTNDGTPNNKKYTYKKQVYVPAP